MLKGTTMNLKDLVVNKFDELSIPDTFELIGIAVTQGGGTMLLHFKRFPSDTNPEWFSISEKTILLTKFPPRNGYIEVYRDGHLMFSGPLSAGEVSNYDAIMAKVDELVEKQSRLRANAL